MGREYAVITDPNNLKAHIYRSLGYEVLNNGLHQATGQAEREYDARLGINFKAPLKPIGGRGVYYPADVALEKALAARDHASRNLITTDACWTDGRMVLNKPGNDPNGIEEALEWWMRKRGLPVGNMGGTAFLDISKDQIELILTELDFGVVSPRAELEDFRYLLELEEAKGFSGGINIFRAIENGIVQTDRHIRWRRFSYGTYKVNTIPAIPSSGNITTDSPRFVGGGDLGIDTSNKLSIYALLYCVEP